MTGNIETDKANRTKRLFNDENRVGCSEKTPKNICG
jgi:hypothetical protein